MTAYVTLHEGSLARGANGSEIPLLGRRLTNRNSLAVGTVVSSTVAPCDCIASISVTENCCVEIGAQNAANGANSEVWLAGKYDNRPVKEGQYVSVIAIA